MNKYSIRIRRTIFVVSTVAICLFYALVDMLDCCSDVVNPLIVYGVEIIFLVLCAFFYTWWGFTHKQSTSIYNWMTIFIYCMMLDASIELYARYLYIFNQSECLNLIELPVWYFRGIPKIIALVYMTSLIVGRVLANKKDGGAI